MTKLRKVIPLEKRKVLKKALFPTMMRLLIAIPVFLVFFWLIDTVATGNSPSALAMRNKEGQLLFAVLFLICTWAFGAMAYEVLYFMKYFYDIDENNLIIRKGVIIQREAILPFSKITDVYVDQDGLDVLFAIFDVHISTPTVASGEFAHIDGVSRKNASILRDMILERINKDTETQQAADNRRQQTQTES